MKISHSWLQMYFDQPLPAPEALADLFNFHVFEVEGIEKVGAGMSPHVVYDIKVLPDRAHYALSHRGVASEVAAIIGVDRKVQVFPKAESIKAGGDGMNSASGISELSIKIEAQNFCPRYIGRRVSGIAVTESPAWLKTYLESVGARSINNIVDVTNFVMFDIGQPLHAFDADKVKGGIVVRQAKAGEKITVLDRENPAGKEITLTENDHVIADDEGPLAIAGVKGGKRAEVSNSTKNLIIESANFEAVSVRRTATRVGIRNESSKRFENAITPEFAAEGMERVSALIKEMMPAAIFGELIDLYPTPVKPWTINVSIDFISKRLGVVVPEKEITDILSRLGISSAKNTGGADNTILTLTIPTERLDLMIPEDIVEEVGRIYGYEKIPGVLPPAASTELIIDPEFYWTEKIKNILVEAGFSEVFLYTLVPKGEFEVAYPLASDKSYLRTNLTDLLSKSLETNARNSDLLGLDAIKQFEIGKIFSKGAEVLALSIGVRQIKKIKGVDSSKVLTEIVGELEKKLGTALGMSLNKMLQDPSSAVCEIYLNNIVSKLPPPTSYDDLSLSKARDLTYKSFSPYPFIVRDIAVFVPENIKPDDVWKIIAQSIVEMEAEKIFRYENGRHRPFDTFTKKMEDGTVKISYAFRLIFQSLEKTLVDDDANKVMEKIYARVAEQGWQVR